MLSKFETLTLAELTPVQAGLVSSARRALAQAYSPYSGVRVGAALRTAEGEVICAANIENSAYGSTLCAERAALAAAYASDHRDFTALAVVIAAGSGKKNEIVAAPCGACRQMLHEAAKVSKTPMQVILSNPSGQSFVVTDMDSLLPLAFGSGHLS